MHRRRKLLGGRDEDGEMEEEEEGYEAYRSPVLAPAMSSSPSFCRSSSSSSSGSEEEERRQQEEAGEGRVKMELLYVRPRLSGVSVRHSRHNTSYCFLPKESRQGLLGC